MNYLDLIVCAASVAEVAMYYTDSSVRNLAILRAPLALLGSDEIDEELLEQQLIIDYIYFIYRGYRLI